MCDQNKYFFMDTNKSTIINLNVFVPIWNRDGAVAIFWQLLLLLDPVVNVSLSTGNVPDVEQSHAELLLSIKQTKTRRSFSVKQFSNYWHNDSHTTAHVCIFSSTLNVFSEFFRLMIFSSTSVWWACSFSSRLWSLWRSSHSSVRAVWSPSRSSATRPCSCTRKTVCVIFSLFRA